MNSKIIIYIIQLFTCVFTHASHIFPKKKIWEYFVFCMLNGITIFKKLDIKLFAILPDIELRIEALLGKTLEVLSKSMYYLSCPLIIVLQLNKFTDLNFFI